MEKKQLDEVGWDEYKSRFEHGGKLAGLLKKPASN